jgi:hypothetical protein
MNACLINALPLPKQGRSAGGEGGLRAARARFATPMSRRAAPHDSGILKACPAGSGCGEDHDVETKNYCCRRLFSV